MLAVCRCKLSGAYACQVLHHPKVGEEFCLRKAEMGSPILIRAVTSLVHLQLLILIHTETALSL